MLVKILIVIGFCLLFWLGCYVNTGTDKKNLLSFRSYPKEIQQIIYEDDTLSKNVPAAINLFKVLLSNIITFTVIFAIVGIILKYTIGFKGFADTFLYFLIFGEVINLFDLVVIDLLWWRNSKRIRFSFAPDKKLYTNPKAHIDSFLRGVPTFAVTALLAAGIIQILP